MVHNTNSSNSGPVKATEHNCSVVSTSRTQRGVQLQLQRLQLQYVHSPVPPSPGQAGTGTQRRDSVTHRATQPWVSNAARVARWPKCTGSTVFDSITMQQQAANQCARKRWHRRVQHHLAMSAG